MLAEADARERRGLEIAAQLPITQQDGVWLVPSQRCPGQVYQVVLDSTCSTCSCPDFMERRQPCKHIHAARVVVERRHGMGRRSDDLRIGVPAAAPRWVTSELDRANDPSVAAVLPR